MALDAHGKSAFFTPGSGLRLTDIARLLSEGNMSARSDVGTVAATVAAVFVAAFALAAQGDDPPPSRTTEAARLRARGQLLGYNLDRDAALASFREAMVADPTDPAAYRLTAAALWIGALFEQGAVTAEDYLGQARSDPGRKPPPAQLDVTFREHLDRALLLAEERCRASCGADAHFQLGAAYGYQATYAATIEGSLFGTLRAARRAYAEHERVLELDPSRKDAGLIVGMYRYAIASLSLPSRLIARVAGFSGGKEFGLRMVEEAAAYPSDVQTNARFTLIVIYNREKRFDDALRVVAELQQQYPRNRLLWLEAGSTALRGGRPETARQSLERGLGMLAADPRPRAFGELARWGYYHGAALVALNETTAARRALDAALADPSRPWVQGRIHIELGKLADLAGDRPHAVDEYRRAVPLCDRDDDDLCVKQARALLKVRYR
jgi:tetratricopeptide (TPR) repeat protein